MAIPLYLAMTAGEWQGCTGVPEHMAWMACHFSPYSTGLSNCPPQLPGDALIIVNDRTPISGHDPSVIAGQLNGLIEKFRPRGILLDFQRPDEPETKDLAQHLVRELSCPVCVCEAYARELESPVFLSPPRLNGFLADHLAPWKGREIWLEAALGGEVITLTKDGSTCAPLPPGRHPEGGHRDERLHCHYLIDTEENARFTLFRTREDLDGLLAEAESLGITQTVGLWQELGR